MRGRWADFLARQVETQTGMSNAHCITIATQSNLEDSQLILSESAWIGAYLKVANLEAVPQYEGGAGQQPARQQTR